MHAPFVMIQKNSSVVWEGPLQGPVLFLFKKTITSIRHYHFAGRFARPSLLFCGCFFGKHVTYKGKRF